MAYGLLKPIMDSTTYTLKSKNPNSTINLIKTPTSNPSLTIHHHLPNPYAAWCRDPLLKLDQYAFILISSIN